MDYSNVAAESDQLAGPSPWGSNSPKADRTSFPTSSANAPPSPTRSPYPPQQSSPPAPRYQGSPALGSQQDTTVASQESSLPPPSIEDQQQGGHAAHAAQAPEQQAYQQSQYAGQQQQQRPGAARYQQARQQRQVPQYKLQAKITALERTGRKDPVLRFDVNVWNTILGRCMPLTLLPDQST